MRTVSVDVTTLAIMALSKVDREQFFAEPHVAALSVSAEQNRGPLTVPVWYQYSPAVSRGCSPAPVPANTG